MALYNKLTPGPADTDPYMFGTILMLLKRFPDADAYRNGAVI